MVGKYAWCKYGSSCWLRVEVAKYSPRLQDTVVHSPPALAKVVAPSCKKEGRLWRRVRCDGREETRSSHSFKLLLAPQPAFPFPLLPNLAHSTWCNFYPRPTPSVFDHPSQFIRVLVKYRIVRNCNCCKPGGGILTSMTKSKIYQFCLTILSLVAKDLLLRKHYARPFR